MISDYRKMRALLIYDLPSVEKEDIKEYNRFHKEIQKVGFYMLQFSVYVKVLTNESEYEKITKKVNAIIPKKGSIILIRLTEKQYNEMKYLHGEKNKYDSIVGSNEVIIIGGDVDD